MSNTPETDIHEYESVGVDCGSTFVDAEFARSLESRLRALESRLRECQELAYSGYGTDSQLLYRDWGRAMMMERDAIKAKLAEAEKNNEYLQAKLDSSHSLMSQLTLSGTFSLLAAIDAAKSSEGA